MVTVPQLVEAQVEGVYQRGNNFKLKQRKLASVQRFRRGNRWNWKLTSGGRSSSLNSQFNGLMSTV
eukprot:2873378-Amphidinium_carterae.1